MILTNLRGLHGNIVAFFMLSEHCFVVKLPKSEYLPSFAKAVILHPKTEIVNLFLYIICQIKQYSHLCLHVA